MLQWFPDLFKHESMHSVCNKTHVKQTRDIRGFLLSVLR